MKFRRKRFSTADSGPAIDKLSIVVCGLLLLLLGLPSLSGADASPPAIVKADSVLIRKADRRLYLIKDGKPFKEFQIALGKDPSGAKLFEGDNKTPEGDYFLDWRNDNSVYYKSIHVSYPNNEDIAFARVVGSRPGGNIMIHGVPDTPDYPAWLYIEFDWTDGCIAVSNEAMDEIWASVEEGTPIRILP